MIRLVAPLLAAVVAATACDVLRPHQWHGAPLDPPAEAPRLALTTSGGRAFDLAAERGRVVLVMFGYTHCPDVCPTTLADWAKAKRALGADTARVRWVFVSVDPERDTPDAAAEYARRFDPSFVGVSGTPGEVGVVTSAWGIAATPEAPATDAGGAAPHAMHGAHDTTDAREAALATIAHTARTFAVDPQGRLRVLYTPDTPPADLADDLRHLMD